VGRGLFLFAVIFLLGCTAVDVVVENETNEECEIECYDDEDCYQEDIGQYTRYDCLEAGTCSAWCSYGVPEIDAWLRDIGREDGFGGLLMNVTGFERGWAYFEDGEWVEAEGNNDFIIVDIKIRNIGDESRYVHPMDFWLTDRDGFYRLSRGGEPVDWLEWGNYSIPADGTSSGSLVFERLKIVDDLVVVYDFSSIADRPAYIGWELSAEDSF